MGEREVVRRNGVEMGRPGGRSIGLLGEKIQPHCIVGDGVDLHCLCVKQRTRERGRIRGRVRKR